MKELLTAREVQELLKVDRVTVYRMLKDGRLSGVKVGQQWRFDRGSVDRLLGGEQPEQRPPSRPADVLPLHCIQPIQDVFAEVAGVSAVTVAPDGEPLTTPSGSCRFCTLIHSSPSGLRACRESWRQLVDAQPGAFATCHAGLNYTHGAIKVDGELVALVVAGQFHAEAPDMAALQRQAAHLAATHGLDGAALAEAAAAIPVLEARVYAQLAGWLRRVAGTFETIAHERAALLCRLRRIAEMTVLDA